MRLHPLLTGVCEVSKYVPVYMGGPEEPGTRPAKTSSASSGGIFASIGNAVVDAGRSLISGIVSTVKPILPGAISAANAALAQLSYSGSVGNFQSASENITLNAKFQPIVEQYPEKIGSPLYKAVYLNTLSGFVLCKDAVFSSNTATQIEESAIEVFLNSGFFYE